MARQNAGIWIHSSLFNWDAKRRSFSAEESTLRRGPRTPHTVSKLFQPIYPDAADVGFPMLSTASGKTAWFALSREDVAEGETQSAKTPGWPGLRSWLSTTRSSMTRVLKAKIEFADIGEDNLATVHLPAGARFISAINQREGLVVYAECPNKSNAVHQVLVVGTDHTHDLRG